MSNLAGKRRAVDRILAGLLLICPTPLAQTLPASVAALPPIPSAGVSQNEPSSAAAIELRIGSGDLLNVSVYGVPEFNQDVRVSSQGDISLPLLGMVRVAGFTTQAAQSVLEQRLVQGGFFVNPHVSVFAKEYATQGISVMGEVQKPGIYALLGSRRLFDVVSAAGGTTPKAGRLVSITRRDHPQQPINVTLSNDPAQAMQGNVEVFPGDTIVVSKAGIVYVVGDVRRPSGVVMENGSELTVLQAIAMAEGANATAALDHAKLIRKRGSGMEEIPISLKKLLAAKAPDVKLQADDIVFVPSSAGKTVGRRSLEAILQAATGVAIYHR